MTSDPWKRYQELEKVYDKASGTFSLEEYELNIRILVMEIAEFLLKPYWDIKKEKDDH